MDWLEAVGLGASVGRWLVPRPELWLACEPAVPVALAVVVVLVSVLDVSELELGLICGLACEPAVPVAVGVVVVLVELAASGSAVGGRLSPCGGTPCMLADACASAAAAPAAAAAVAAGSAAAAATPAAAALLAVSLPVCLAALVCAVPNGLFM